MRMVQEPTEVTLASGKALLLLLFVSPLAFLFLLLSCWRLYLPHIPHINPITGKSYTFRKGDRVGLCPPLWHRDPEIYPEPLAFRPERWEAQPGSSPEEVTSASLGKIPQFKGGKQIR